MNEVDFLADEITQRYGTVKRARGSFLYTAKGVRLTDLYLENGRAILGWGGGSAFTMFKNVLCRGITGSYCTDFTPQAGRESHSQFSRAVSSLLAGPRIVFVFTDRQRALQAALRLTPGSTSFWKPWSGDVDWRTVDSVIIEPPLPWTAGVYLLAVTDTPETESALAALAADSEKAVVSAHIPAPLAAAVTRSMYDMIKALQTREEKDWFIYDQELTPYWTRKGPYLYPKVARGNYGAFILHCLDCGIVISPVYEQPSIVPFGADRGVFSKLKADPFTAK